MLANTPIMEIACVATLRPSLLRTTLYSHAEYLFKKYLPRIKLILNIDCTGLIEPDNKNEKEDKIAEILNIVNRMNFASIEYRVAEPPHFGHAWFYVMNQVRSPFIFYLEEDWRLDMEISFRAMMELMIKNPNIAHLRLSAFRSETDHLKQWNKFLHWNDLFFEVDALERGVIGWAGHPSINRTSFIVKVLAHIRPSLNPEKQIKGRRYNHPINNILSQYRFGSFHPQDSSAAVVDIGRQWMLDNGYKKHGNKAFFVEWEKEKQC